MYVTSLPAARGSCSYTGIGAATHVCTGTRCSRSHASQLYKFRMQPPKASNIAKDSQLPPTEKDIDEAWVAELPTLPKPATCQFWFLLVATLPTNCIHVLVLA